MVVPFPQGELKVRVLTWRRLSEGLLSPTPSCCASCNSAPAGTSHPGPSLPAPDKQECPQFWLWIHLFSPLSGASFFPFAPRGVTCWGGAPPPAPFAPTWPHSVGDAGGPAARTGAHSREGSFAVT